jgi:hypothetical protein
LKLVIDASVAVAAAANPLGFERFRCFELVAPPLLWIEAVSTLHAMVWRGELRSEQAPPTSLRAHLWQTSVGAADLSPGPAITTRA